MTAITPVDIRFLHQYLRDFFRTGDRHVERVLEKVKPKVFQECCVEWLDGLVPQGQLSERFPNVDSTSLPPLLRAYLGAKHPMDNYSNHRYTFGSVFSGVD